MQKIRGIDSFLVLGIVEKEESQLLQLKCERDYVELSLIIFLMALRDLADAPKQIIHTYTGRLIIEERAPECCRLSFEIRSRVWVIGDFSYTDLINAISDEQHDIVLRTMRSPIFDPKEEMWHPF